MFRARYSKRTEEEAEPPDSRTCRHTRPASWAERAHGQSTRSFSGLLLEQTGGTNWWNPGVMRGCGWGGTGTVAAQHPRLDQGRSNGALVKHTGISTRQLTPRSRDQHLHTSLHTPVRQSHDSTDAPQRCPLLATWARQPSPTRPTNQSGFLHRVADGGRGEAAGRPAQTSVQDSGRTGLTTCRAAS